MPLYKMKAKSKNTKTVINKIINTGLTNAFIRPRTFRAPKTIVDILNKINNLYIIYCLNNPPYQK